MGKPPYTTNEAPTVLREDGIGHQERKKDRKKDRKKRERM
jgi:hypothetical protein